MEPTGRDPTWRRYLRFLRPDPDADIDAELRFHFEERIAQLVRLGASETDARAQALDDFGDVRAVRDDLRAIDARIVARQSRTRLLTALLEDIRLAYRRLVRQPGFTIPAVLTLSLGVAATVAIYTVLNAVVLSPLPYPHAERLVALDSPMPKLDDRWGLARHQLFYYEKESRGIEALALHRADVGTLAGDGSGRAAERVPVAVVSAGIFDVLGIRPALGRVLLSSDNLSPIPSVAVLGHEAWVSRYGSDPSIVGRSIDVDGIWLQIVGVAPPEAQLPDQRVDLWLPDHIDPAMPAMNNHVRKGVARLRDGWTAEALERELRPLVARMEELFPQAYGNQWITRTGFSTAVRPLRDVIVGETVTRTLWILLGAVGILFAIALANVANLFLVRGEGRQRELSLREALGADRARLAVHHLTDALLVAIPAGALASVLVVAAVRALVALSPEGVPRLGELQPDAWHVALSFAVSIVAGLTLALVPVTTVRTSLAALREGGSRLTPSRRRLAIRGALVMGQVALAVLLLAGASLLMRSFQRIRQVQLGFRPAHVTTMALALPTGRYIGNGAESQDARIDAYRRASAFYEQLEGALRQVPGVEAVGFTSKLPLTGKSGCSGMVTDGTMDGGRREKCITELQVTPGYFEAMGIRLTGRAPTWGETNALGAGVVVTRSVADIFWPGQDPIGRGIRCCNAGPPYFTVVGVADDVHDEGLESAPMEGVYSPMIPQKDIPMNAYPGYMTLAVRAPTLTAEALAGIVQREVARLDPAVAVAEVRSMEQVVSRSMARRTFTMILLAVAAGAALLLSAVGLYGVVSYTVLQRRGEIGIRVALGARASSVALLVARQSMRIVAAGLVLGVVGAFGATRVLGALLYGVSPTDPLALVAVVVTLALVAVLATVAPTWRATRVHPAETLRSD